MNYEKKAQWATIIYFAAFYFIGGTAITSLTGIPYDVVCCIMLVGVLATLGSFLLTHLIERKGVFRWTDVLPNRAVDPRIDIGIRLYWLRKRFGPDNFAPALVYALLAETKFFPEATIMRMTTDDDKYEVIVRPVASTLKGVPCEQ